MRQLTAKDVTFTLTVEPEFTPVRGNAMASGDDAADKECEDEILDALANGFVWSWCTVKVTASWKEWAGFDYLGCCSYANEKAFMSDGYYSDMCDNALADLNNSIGRSKVISKGVITMRNDNWPTDDDISRALDVLRADYYRFVKQDAQQFIDRIRAKEWERFDQFIDCYTQEQDGCQRVIYTAMAKQVAFVSDYEDTAREELTDLGCENPTPEQIAFHCIYNEVLQEIGSEDAFDDYLAEGSDRNE